MGSFIDLIGQRFGSLIVQSLIGPKKGQTYWQCKCDCGTEKSIRSGVLRNGTTKSCGKRSCLPLSSIGITDGLIGKKFGWLTPIEYKVGQGWLCKCDCGNTAYAKSWTLESDSIKSCGCQTNRLLAKAASLPNNKGLINYIIRRYKYGAQERNLDYNLSFEEVKNLVLKKCFYCGSKPRQTSFKRKFGDDRFNGLDRKDNSKGYYIENIVTCCKICNRAKSGMNYDEFILWLDGVANFRSKNEME